MTKTKKAPVKKTAKTIQFGACIISANYRDTSSPFKYLVRNQGEALETAVACKHVEALKVEFVSSVCDPGFGLKIVAVAQQAVISGVQGRKVKQEEGLAAFVRPECVLTPIRFYPERKRFETADGLDVWSTPLLECDAKEGVEASI